MGLKKLGQDITFTVEGNSSSYVRNLSRNFNTTQIDTTGMADAALGWKTSQAGARALEISLELMHPAAGEAADQVYTDLWTALENRTTVDVVYDTDTYADMAVIGGEETAGPDEVVSTKFTLTLTAAPAGS